MTEPNGTSERRELEAADARAAAAGDAEAFERLYRAHVQRVYGLTCRLAGAERADELTQDVFVRAWQKLHTFRGDAAFGSWLYRLAVNLCYGRLRTIGTERKRYADGEIPLGRAQARRDGTEIRLDFDVAIERLPDGARQVFVLHDVEGYKHREIAEMVGITTGTSKSQLHRARMILREHLNA
ncbi:MAG: RNA polymerase sigma factor [Gemmatimonadetes bacterium]|nr:RNA polymerase sigma factor [Gemmatimonadota bacterium]